jgi:hypothetical protein
LEKDVDLIGVTRREVLQDFSHKFINVFGHLFRGAAVIETPASGAPPDKIPVWSA